MNNNSSATFIHGTFILFIVVFIISLFMAAHKFQIF